MRCCKCEEYYWDDPQPVEYVDEAGKGYCLFHAPANHKMIDGCPYVSVAAFNAAVFHRIATVMARNKESGGNSTCDMSGTIFLGGIKFSDGNIESAFPTIDFCWVKFSEYTSFDNMEFSAATSFAGATFGKRTSFGWGTFGKMTSFDGTKFGEKASFDDATFGEKASFGGATFGDNASFGGATFGKGASLEGATFGKTASFDDATFGDNASFDGARFGEVTFFDGATFGDATSFAGATFGDATSFGGATFGEKAKFSRATFGDNAQFDRATFGDNSNFDGARFGKMTSFDGVTFGANARFYEATFGENADFRKATFGEKVSFVWAIFKGESEFSGVHFAGSVSFLKARFQKTAKFTRAVLGGEANFQEVKVKDNALRMHALDATSLANLHFTSLETDLFSFKGCDWPKMLLPEADGLQSGTDCKGLYRDNKACEELYRSLKHKAEAEYDRPMTSQWHYREKLMKLEGVKLRYPYLWPVHWLGLYWRLCGFGECWVPPLKALGGMVLFCLLLLGLGGMQNGPQIIWGPADIGTWGSAWEGLQNLGVVCLTLLKNLLLVKDEASSFKPIFGVAEFFLLLFTRLLIPLQAAFFAIALRNAYRR